MSKLTAERLREMLHYDPTTGIFTNRCTRNGAARVGQQSGKLHVTGYRIISLDNERHQAHRLAWLYITGQWPKDEIDHIDRDRANNAWVNLRVVTRSENSMNRSVQRGKNATRHVGIYARRNGKWIAGIRVSGRQMHLGTFSTEEQALAAYNAAKSRFHRIETYEAA